MSHGTNKFLQILGLFFLRPPTGISNRTTIADGNTWNHERKFASSQRCAVVVVHANKCFCLIVLLCTQLQISHFSD
jgi:hypothetical protein